MYLSATVLDLRHRAGLQTGEAFQSHFLSPQPAVDVSSASTPVLPIRPAQPNYLRHQDLGFGLSESAATAAQIKAPAMSSATPAWSSAAAPGEQTPARSVHRPPAARTVHADKQQSHPLRGRPRGWWQANGEISQGTNIRATFPLLAAHYGSDLRASGLISVAGGTSGLHINYLMNVALFSVHESFMT